jgi:hypothetical protein
MKAPPVAASEALGGCSFLEAESCKAIYADLRPRGILACETIHNKLSARENPVWTVPGDAPLFIRSLSRPSVRGGRAIALFQAHVAQTKDE